MKRRNVLLGVGLVGATALIATAAQAFWSTPSAGTGTGRTATFSVTATARTAGGPLVPGGTADVVVAVDNPNTVGLAITFKFGIIASDASECPGTALAASAPTTLTTAVPGPNTFTLHGAALLQVDAPSACQGATFSIPVTVTAEVAA